MPVLSNSKQKPIRASFARMLAHLTFGFGVTAGATLLAPLAFAQSCDKCAGMSSPSCGCELPSVKLFGPKPCNCVRKPSVGERILSHLDRVGDQIEAKSKRGGKGVSCGCESPKEPSCGCETHQGPNCGCETAQVPSCGCEVCSRADVLQGTPVQLPPIQSALLRPNAGQSTQSAKGALVDKPSQLPPSPIGKQPVAKKLDLIPPDESVGPSENRYQRAPFEPKKSAAPQSTTRIPAVETGPSLVAPPKAAPSIPNALKPIPSEVPPAWTPNAIPPKSKGTAPTETNLPDVFVDPFKDDVSSNRKNESLIQLTSDRQIATNPLRLDAPEPAAADHESTLSIDRPARLTPQQMLSTTPKQASGNLQFEASESTSKEAFPVVSSSYLHAIPVPVVVRKELVRENKELPQKLSEAPSVSKIRVPTRR